MRIGDVGKRYTRAARRVEADINVIVIGCNEIEVRIGLLVIIVLDHDRLVGLDNRKHVSIAYVYCTFFAAVFKRGTFSTEQEVCSCARSITTGGNVISVYSLIVFININIVAKHYAESRLRRSRSKAVHGNLCGKLEIHFAIYLHKRSGKSVGGARNLTLVGGVSSLQAVKAETQPNATTAESAAAKNLLFLISSPMHTVITFSVTDVVRNAESALCVQNFIGTIIINCNKFVNMQILKPLDNRFLLL